MWAFGSLIQQWNHIWLWKSPIKEFERKISLCCSGISKWSHKNINLSSPILALVLWLLHKDWIRSDPFLSKRNKTIHPRGWGYSSGKIPAGHNKIYLLDIFEWIQSLQRGRHRSLAVASWWRKVCIKTYCLGNPSQPETLDYSGVVIWGRCLQIWHSYVLHFFLFLH